MSVLLPLTLISAGGWIGWRSSWTEAETGLKQTTEAGVEYAARVMSSYVVAAGRLDDLTKPMSDQEIVAHEGDLHQAMLNLFTELPAAYSANILDRAGRVLVNGAVFPVPRDRPGIEDRDFFAALSSSSPRPVHVSQLYLSRLTGIHAFAVSRRRTVVGRPTTEFNGIVNVLVRPEIAMSGLKRLIRREGEVITLARADGQVLGSTTPSEAPWPPIASSSPFNGVVANEARIASFIETSGPVPRLVFAGRVEGLPLYVLVSIPTSAIFDDWVDRMAEHLIFGIPATVSLLILSLLVRRNQLSLADNNERLERELGQTDARLRRVQAAGGALSFEIGPDNTVVCDDAFRALWGLPPNGRIEVGAVLARVHPDDQERVMAEYDRLATEGGSFAIEHRLKTQNGRTQWLMQLGESIPGAGRVPPRLVGVVMDITARKDTQAAVQESEERLRNLVATLDLATVFVRGMDGTIQFWSEGCTRLFGWTAEEAVGQPAHTLLQTTFYTPFAVIEESLFTTGEWVGELRQVHRDGHEIVVAIRKVLQRDSDLRGIAVMESCSDVTALTQTRLEMEALNHKLEVLVQEEVSKRQDAQLRAAHAERIQVLGQLAGGIAHDLNNVLQAVTSGASLAAREAHNPDRVRRLARLVTEAAQRGAAVTSRLLSFSRRADLRAEAIDPAGLLSGLVEVLLHTLGGHVTCVVDASKDLPPLFADRGQLETALVNLATNARDAMPNGGIITLSASEETVMDELSHPGGAAPGRYIRLSVTDHGTGMDPATLAQVTEPFFTTKRDGHGTGLGLSMVAGFAAQSGGALAIKSALGDGTTVSLWLPQADVKVRARTDASPDFPGRPGSLRILLVDDDPMVREPLSQQLEAIGYDVSIAQGGPDALEFLDVSGTEPRPPVDVMICDLSMPGMSGLEVIRNAQARWALLPAILVTGYAGDTAALSTGGATYAILRKPVTVEELGDVIAILLAGRAPAHVSSQQDAASPMS